MKIGNHHRNLAGRFDEIRKANGTTTENLNIGKYQWRKSLNNNATISVLLI